MFSTGGEARASLNRATELHAIDPKPGDLSMGQVEVGVKTLWRTEPTPVAMVADDLWIAEKF